MTSKFPQREIGGDPVSAEGLGCMGMSFSYSSFGGFNEEESAKVLTRAADMGVTLDIYGPHTNEELIGKWFQTTGRRNEIFLCSKFGVIRQKGVEHGKVVSGTRGDAAYVREACEASLARLQTDHLDLFYIHRVDSETPIEVTIGAMAELKKEGKIRHLGISECSARTLRRACAVHPIAAAQMEYSPFALEIEDEQTEFLKTARELGVKIVAYSPLGRGFLTNTIKSRADFDEKDNRLNHPRFSEQNFPENLRLVQTLAEIASRKGCSAGQLSIAWVLAQGNDFIPIPGTKRVKYLEENAKAVDIKLSSDEEAEIRKVIESVGGSKGKRYPPAMMGALFGDTVELK